MGFGRKAFLILLLGAFACAPVRVKVYREESPTATTPSKKPGSEKGHSEKTVQEEPLSGKTPSTRPSREARIPPGLSPTETPRGKTYEEAVSQWRSYQDLIRWMEKEFSTDMDRYKRFEGTLPLPRTPEETFELRSGIYIDAALFAKATLDRIDPSLKAQVLVLLVRPYRYNHYVCSFTKEGEMFILDYGTPYREVTGVHGPYRSLDQYKRFYEKHHPAKREVEAITYLP